MVTRRAADRQSLRRRNSACYTDSRSNSSARRVLFRQTPQKSCAPPKAGPARARLVDHQESTYSAPASVCGREAWRPRLADTACRNDTRSLVESRRGCADLRACSGARVAAWLVLGTMHGAYPGVRIASPFHRLSACRGPARSGTATARRAALTHVGPCSRSSQAPAFTHDVGVALSSGPHRDRCADLYGGASSRRPGAGTGRRR
jgi:hypothetical protein